MPTKIVFGLRLTEPSVLVVTGTPKDPAPALRVLHGADTMSVTYAAANKGWRAELKAGTYLVRLDCDDAQDFDGRLDVAIEGPPATFISLAPARKVVAWTSTATGSDPKDPWPPPVVTPDADETWLTDAVRRSGPVVPSAWRAD